LCLALGSASSNEVTETEKEAWQPVLQQWHCQLPEAVTHAASGFALRAWRLPVPDVSESSVATTGYDWEWTKMGLTMLRIPAGNLLLEQKQIEVAEFLLSDAEVTTGLFQQFLEDAQYKYDKPTDWEGWANGTTRTLENPAQQTSWYDAVLFCNWLSRREGRTPCYERSGALDKMLDPDNKTVHYPAWGLIDAADGYRLPTEVQWEYACRAGTTTQFALGESETWLRRYAVYNASHSAPVRSKLCNGWGLFDMHGNLWEWCHDLFRPGVLESQANGGYPSGSERSVRGGSWFGASGFCRSNYRIYNTPANRGYSVGFRVVRVR
jgi:formylglycine-generating enzyme required for sulfatase activity